MNLRDDNAPWHCPEDGHALVNAGVHPWTCGVCRTCRGIWLPVAVRSLIAEADTGGWRVYIHWSRVGSAHGACPDCGGSMVRHQTPGERVLACGNCRGLWIPGKVLKLNQSRSDKVAANRRQLGLRSVAPPLSLRDTGYVALLNDAANAAGVDTTVIDELVYSSKTLVG